MFARHDMIPGKNCAWAFFGADNRNPEKRLTQEKPMNEIERILDQLKRAYEGGAWHGPSVKEVLNGVTAEQAQARPIQNGHTIYELVRHIAVWEDVGRRRLQGDPAEVPISSAED